MDWTSLQGKHIRFHTGMKLFAVQSDQKDKYLTTGNEGDVESGLDYRNARFSDPEIRLFRSVDPLRGKYFMQSSYCSFDNNPILKIDPAGKAAMQPDWVEKSNGDIKWDENVTSTNDKDLQSGDKYLGRNVLVGTHNRDANLKEPINSAQFDIYLETNIEGPSATIMGNTLPADVKIYNTLAEGLYPARSQGRASYLSKGKKDLAILINEGKAVPTVPGSPIKTMTEIFFHSGNNYQKSLYDSKGKAYSIGCQTSLCESESLAKHNSFMNTVGKDFKGSYYLRSKPKIEVKKSN